MNSYIKLTEIATGLPVYVMANSVLLIRPSEIGEHCTITLFGNVEISVKESAQSVKNTLDNHKTYIKTKTL